MSEDSQIYSCDESGTLQFRQEVPADLQELVGKKVIKRAIGTRDQDAAERIAAGFAAEYAEIFAKIRGDKGIGVDAGIFSYVLYTLRDQL